MVFAGVYKVRNHVRYHSTSGRAACARGKAPEKMTRLERDIKHQVRFGA